MINGYKNKVYNAQIEKNNKLIELETKYKNQKQNAKEEYNKIILKSKKNMINELKNTENNYYYEFNKLKEKWEKEKKIINDKYVQINENDKNNLEVKINTLDKNFKNEIYNCTILIEEKINHFTELVKINEVIYNADNKYRENFYYNKNIINLLLNYYEKGIDDLKDIQNNNEFMEAKNQKEYDKIIKIHQIDEKKKEELNKRSEKKKGNTLKILIKEKKKKKK